MDVTKSDIELIQEFEQGQQAAFAELVSRYEDRAYNLALRMTRNPEDAEEVLQDVFTTVFRKIDGFEGKSSFSSWLYRVTVNASLMKLRKRRQNKNLHLEDLMPQVENSYLISTSEDQDVDQKVFLRELREELEEAIQRLPDEYRPIFILRDIDGLTSKEVSKLLQLSVPAIKSRLHRSRLILRRRLAQIYREHGRNKSNDRSVGNI